VIAYQIPNLKRLCTGTGRSIADLANESEVSCRTLYNAITGSAVTSENVHKICTVLECKPTDLMTQPDVQSALNDLANEIKKYRLFVGEVYDRFEDRLPGLK